MIFDIDQRVFDTYKHLVIYLAVKLYNSPIMIQDDFPCITKSTIIDWWQLKKY